MVESVHPKTSISLIYGLAIDFKRLRPYAIDVKTEKGERVERRHLCQYMNLDFLFQNTPIITPEEWPVQLRDA
jgi:hypothetical protein